MATDFDPNASSAASAEQQRMHAAHVELSEADFLNQQAQAARDALSRTAQELVNNLGKTVDPRALAKDELLAVGQRHGEHCLDAVWRFEVVEPLL